MPFYKKLLIGLGAVAVIGAIAASAVFYFTRGVADAATDFFATVAASGPHAAYAKASPAFRQGQSESDFEELVARAGLRGFKEASWPNRKIENGQGSVTGTVTLDGGVTLPAVVRLTKSAAGEWQVFNFVLTPPGASDGQPPKAEQPAENAPPPKIESSATAGDEVSAKIGDKTWASSGDGMIAIRLGDLLLVQTAPTIQSGTVDLTTLKLQFDGNSGQPQTLGRDCLHNTPCIELSKDGNQYKIDRNSAQSAILRITRAEGGTVEGTFSADMESLDGKVSIRDGHFHVSVKQ
jgi:hypothetical protein